MPDADGRQLRKDYEQERARVDRLIDALIDVVLLSVGAEDDEDEPDTGIHLRGG